MCPHTCVVNLPKPREHHPGTYCHVEYQKLFDHLVFNAVRNLQVQRWGQWVLVYWIKL